MNPGFYTPSPWLLKAVKAIHVPRFLLDQELQCQGRGVRAMREDSTVYKGLITHLERQIEIK